MKRFICCLILVLFVVGCAANPTPAPTVPVPTLAPTWTPQPANTPRPTYTPNPTLTPYPTPTYLPPMPTLAPTAAPTAVPTPVTYVVQPGDWLTIIAQRFNLPQESILAVNNIPDPNHIEVGTVLVIPLTPTLALTGTVAITPTARPVVARPAGPAAPPPQFIYPAPRILYPSNGLTLKYSLTGKDGGTEDIAFVWLPVGKLESGTQPCSWQGQPNGADGWIWDRYHIEFDPPLYSDKLKMSLNVFHNDQGTSREFGLLEFKPDVSYTWRIVVGRWCVSRNHDNQDPKHQGLLGLVSPYSESRTFRYSP